MFYIYDNNEIFTLWISEEGNKLSDLAYLSLKSMVLVGHDVKLYTYSFLSNVPKGVEVLDANSILDKSKIFRYNNKFKTYSGFANWFRFKRMYEYGGTWLDLDILLIKNVNDVVTDEIAICSEPDGSNYIFPNNAFMRFPKGNELIKTMMEYAEDVGSNAKHAETGPRLVEKLINADFYKYNSFLKNFTVNNLLGWYEINKYSKESESLLVDVNIDEIFGFHFVNTHFSRLNLEEYPSGLYNDLRNAIITSDNKKEYEKKLIESNILKMKNNIILKNRDLQYGKITTKNNVKYTFLIDITKLKKVELYTFLTSVEKKINEKCEFIIFGKNNISADSIKFKNNLKIFNSKFENINQYIDKYIGGEYVIPINQPLLIQKNIFIKSNNVDIQIINFDEDSSSKLYVLNHDTFKFFNKFFNIFDLDNVDFNLFNFQFSEYYSKFILSYGNEFNESELQLMKIIDNIPEDDDFDNFNSVKIDISKFFKYNMVERISFYYFSKCKNILESESVQEYHLREELDYLKQYSNRYLDELRYIKNNDLFKKVL